MQKLSYVSAAVAALAFAGACGDGGNNNPDAGPNVDSAPTIDAPESNCTTIAPAPLAFSNSGAGFISWESVLPTSLGSGDSLFSAQFYNVPGTGAVDLATGDNGNYSTCTSCVLVYVLNAAGDAVEKTFYQSGGTLNLTVDPVVASRLTATLTDLSLIEVTIDANNNYISTPVVGGECLSAGTLTFDVNDAPAEWTCDQDMWRDGANCDCMCGEIDPDCAEDLPVVGCTGDEVCPADACVSPCNAVSDPTVGCDVGTCVIFNPTTDICWDTAADIDPADLGETCGADTTWCGVTGSVANGVCDSFLAGDSVCRQVCDGASDCANGESCLTLFAEGTKGLCGVVPANDTCAAPVVLTIGNSADGTTVFATNDYEGGTEVDCTGFNQSGPDVTYRVALTAGQAITVTVTPGAEFDPGIFIVGPGAAACNDAITCLSGADAGVGGDAETFNFTATDAGNYFIVVDSFSGGEAGTFSILVENQ